MKNCTYCSRPANTKVTVRDDYGRVHDIFACDEHAKSFEESQKEKCRGKKNLFPVLKISGDDDSAMVWMEKSS